MKYKLNELLDNQKKEEAIIKIQSAIRNKKAVKELTDKYGEKLEEDLKKEIKKEKKKRGKKLKN